MGIDYSLTYVLDDKDFDCKMGGYFYRKITGGSLRNVRESAIEAEVLRPQLEAYVDRRIRRIISETGKPPKKYTLRVKASG